MRQTFTVEAASEDSVGAHEGTVQVHGVWEAPEPEVNYPGGFRITDITNTHNISVLHLLEDEDWIIATQNRISQL